MPVKKHDKLIRADGYSAYPEDLTLVTDPQDPLFDPRALEPFDENMVKSILFQRQGVKETILVVKRGQDVCIVDGRRRVIAAREVNQRLLASGQETIKVPVKIEYSHREVDLLGLSGMLNAIRKDESYIETAEKVGRYMSLESAKADEAAIQFGVSVTQIKKMLALLTLNNQVIKAIGKGVISASAALEWVDMPHDQQREALASAMEAAPESQKIKKVSIKAAAKAAGKTKIVMPKMKEIKAVLADDDWCEAYRDGVRWARGLCVSSE